MKNTQKRVLAVNDISCFGKCSLTVVLPIVSALGIECTVLPTAILSTHTGGFSGYSFLDMTDEMKKITDHWEREKIGFDCIFTGYLGNADQIEICSSAIDKNKGAFVIVDPVMADSGKLYAGFDSSFAEKMKFLCKKADIITPNYTEACLLSGVEYSEIPTDAETDRCFDGIKTAGIKAAVITGIRTSDDKIKTLYRNFETGTFFETSHPFVNAMLHGGGDVFASVLCGMLMSGKKTEKAISAADTFTYECIKHTETKGQYGLNFEPLIKTLSEY